MSVQNLHRLAAFVADFSDLAARSEPEAALLAEGEALLEDLVRNDDWLPEAYAQPHPERYQQYLLYRDPQARFSVVSFVWGPGQATPVHNHTIWGLVGVLRGAELSQAFAYDKTGLSPKGPVRRVEPGEVEAVSPSLGDIHRVANAFDNRVSISIHVYGADISAVERSTFDEAGQPKRFISGYAPIEPPDLSFQPQTPA